MKAIWNELREFYCTGWDHMDAFGKFFFPVYAVIIGLNLFLTENILSWKMMTVCCFVGWFIAAISNGSAKALFNEMSNLQKRTSNLLDEVMEKYVIPSSKANPNEKGH